MAGVNKNYSAESLQRRRVLIPFVVIMFLLQGIVQGLLDPHARDLRKGEVSLGEVGGSLNNEFLLLPLLGFREAAAGLLWVRCDEFFHSGDYDAILPLVRLITWLDPHADNVFITGAWHLAYNFTDSNERSDRRYIPPAQALLDEGIRNNDNIPDIKFEKGWQCYDKIKDYITAEEAFKRAISTKPSPVSDDFPYGAPLKVHHILAHTYERQGRIAEAIAEWDRALDRSTEMLKNPAQLKGTQSEVAIRMMRDAEKHNRSINVQRWKDRYQAGKALHSEVNPTEYPGVMAPPGGTGEPRPWNVSFQPRIEVVRPKVFKISGRINMADGGRVDVRLTDWDYKEKAITGRLERFDVEQSQTIMQDAISVRKNKFEREMDMSKDPKMYSFSQPSYRLTLTFNTRTTSPHVQDRFGWSGEGLTDKDNPKYLLFDPNPNLRGTKMIDGQGGEGPNWDGVTIPWKEYGQPPRLVRATYRITKEQVQGLKPITDSDIVPNE